MKIICLSIISFFMISCFEDQVDENPRIKNPSDKNLEFDSQYVSDFDQGNHLLDQYYRLFNSKSDQKDKIVEAIQYFEKSLESEYNSIDSTYIVLNKLAECFLILGNHEGSLIYIKKSLLISVHNYETHFLRAKRYQSLNLSNKCIQLCDSLISSDSISNKNIIPIYQMIGDVYSSNQNYKSIDYYNKILVIDPENIPALYGKGLFLQNQTDYGTAQSMYFKIKDLDPNNLHATFNLGYIHLEISDFRNAINYFTDVIVTEPQYYKAYYTRAICYEKLGDVIRAEEDYRKVLEIYKYEDTEERLNRILEDNKKYN